MKHIIETYVFDRIPLAPGSLYDPVRAALAAGGKRARPILTAIWSGSATPSDAWLPAAAAIELLHAFTLAHDDIMDNAPLRRGCPTIHIAYGTNKAILSGDAMIALALEALAECGNSSELLAEFAIGFRGVCEGQALDAEFESRAAVTLDDYLTMIELKTSRIFELAAVMGAIVGGNTYTQRARLFARELGLAFQIQDDLLDLTAPAEFGKITGGDMLEGKRSALFVLAMRHYDTCNGDDRQLLDRLRARQIAEHDIVPIRLLFERMGVLKEAADLAAHHANAAVKHLESIPDMELVEHVLEYIRAVLGPALADRAVNIASN